MTTPAGTIRVAREGSRGWHFIALAKYEADPNAFTVLDDDLKPAAEPAGGDNGSGDGQVSETPDGQPVAIPADWRDMHHTKIIALAKELHGDFDATADKTMTERARSIIEAAEADRANPPAKPE